MATRFALAVRHRTLLLPWDFVWRFDNRAKAHNGCPASGVAYQILSAVDQWPDEADQLMDYFILYSTPTGKGLCYYCKNLTEQKGLHFACVRCIPPDSYTYYQVYCDALHFASKQWDLSRITNEQILIQRLQSSTSSTTSSLVPSSVENPLLWEGSALTKGQRLKLLLRARATKPTENL